jgi:hypothetical protein
VSVDNPPGVAEALWPIPGALLALALSYAYGARREGPPGAADRKTR